MMVGEGIFDGITQAPIAGIDLRTSDLWIFCLEDLIHSLVSKSRPQKNRLKSGRFLCASSYVTT